jgi:uncharacterized LabA/DUF88 family protein
MDIEITMGIYETLSDIDTIILVSGDSDYHSVIQKFHAQGKYIRIYSFANRLSWELKTFAIKNPRCNYILFDDLKDELQFERT